MGIGLYIVKKFAELLQGSVLFKSKPGKGSTCTTTFPGET
jgi:signal transduction histidine kinase